MIVKASDTSKMSFEQEIEIVNICETFDGCFTQLTFLIILKKYIRQTAHAHRNFCFSKKKMKKKLGPSFGVKFAIWGPL
jgi:hypothetical protein